MKRGNHTVRSVRPGLSVEQETTSGDPKVFFLECEHATSAYSGVLLSNHFLCRHAAHPVSVLILNDARETQTL